MKCLLSISGLFFIILSFSQEPKQCKWLIKGTKLERSVLVTSLTSDVSFTLDTNFVFSCKEDSAYVCYSVIPKELSDTIQVYTQSQVFDVESFETVQKKKENQLNKDTKLKTYGAITRGLAVGNNSGNGVDSRLNLSVEGELTKGVFVKAYVSDQDIPIQPDGVTQNAQDLDRIYVSLYTKNKGLTLGDITLQDSSYFLRYLRNLQGISTYTKSLDTNFKLNTKLGIGVSKGKFYSNTLELRNGVLGPYKIVGPASNRFTVVISGSEKVFLDGELLVRGKDYLLDYNQSLVTFLSHILITEYTRVRVDFEYSDLDYFRVNSMAMGEYEQGKLNLKVGYYNEKDNPNKPINSSFSQQDLERLGAIGDNLQDAFIEGESEVSNVNSGIWYRKIKVGVEDVFVYTASLDSAEYEVRFSEVGIGNGEYQIIKRDLNGVIYGYVGPGNGTHLPLVPVALPHRKQMLIADVRYQVSKHINIGNEFAYSIKDHNRYSQLGDDDNEGFANRFYYEIKGLQQSKYKLRWTGSVENVNQNFEEIDRFREVDFNRNWGTNDAVSEGLLLIQNQVKFQKDIKNSFSARGVLLDKVKDESGYSWGLKARKSLSKEVEVYADYEQVSSGYLSSKSKWENSLAGVRYTKNGNQISMNYRLEHNTTKNDTVFTTSQYYDQVGFKWVKDKKLSISHTYRVDKDTLLGQSEFRRNTEAFITQVRYEVLNTRNTFLEINGIHRHANQRSGLEEQVQGGIVIRSKWKTYLIQKIIYDLSSAQELQRQFVFVQVAYGKGSHRFIDFDGDGVQSINEFVEDDIAGDYIKVIVPTNDFIDVYKASLRYQGSWSFGASKYKLFKLFSGKFVFNGSDRTQSNETFTRLLPIKGDSSRAYNQQYLAEFYFHRGKGKYELYYKIKDHDVFNQYLRGEDQRAVHVNQVGVKNQFNGLTLNTYYEWGNTNYKTTIVADNNYQIKHQAIKEELSKIFKRKLSITLLGNYQLKNGVLIKKATFFEFGLRSRLLVKEISLNSNVSYVGINHKATVLEENTQEGFVMLDGLRKGANFRWSLLLQKKITKSIQLNISYQGRKPNTQKVYHIGRVQVTAYF